MLGPEDSAESAGGLHVEQFVLAGQSLTEQQLFERRSAFHGSYLSGGSKISVHYTVQ